MHHRPFSYNVQGAIPTSPPDFISIIIQNATRNFVKNIELKIYFFNNQWFPVDFCHFSAPL